VREGEAPPAASRRPGTTSYLRELNHRAVFDELARMAQSRSRLATNTGLSKPTISGALNHLQRTGVVRTSGYAAGPTGPAAELFELDPWAGFVVGVADLAGTVVTRLKSRNRARTAVSLAAAVADLVGRATGDAGFPAAATGVVVVAVPGVPDQRTRGVQRATLPGIEQSGFLDELDRALGDRCVVENDVNLAAVGEHRSGAAVGVPDFVLVSLRPGLGLSAFVDGRLHVGAHGAAGEIALLPLVAEHPLDRLVRRATRHPGEELMRDEAASSAGAVRLAHRLGLADLGTVGALYAAARDGDRTARRVVRAQARQLSLIVAAAAAVLDPELIVINGAVDETVLDYVRDVLRTVDVVGPALVPGKLGDEAVLLGAIATGLPAARERVFARTLG
jgi:predicted NBD/HSP70 family sugar kinase